MMPTTRDCRFITWLEQRFPTWESRKETSHGLLGLSSVLLEGACLQFLTRAQGVGLGLEESSWEEKRKRPQGRCHRLIAAAFPKGPTFEGSDSKNHTLDGVWNQKARILGT